ncbi:dATP/dGTP pyrophosphohydrolase domain-containing protein, partial [Salmonella enterica]|uniref:dATP/dGTP pyrophosphohydrolase domain-containing protein n=1 Tax=Salmonella enterica TaxID=28901 RepID=UPI003F1D24AC
WDAQRRAGITDEDITHAMVEKLAVNKQREWPEPKDGEPRLHIKEHEIETHSLLKNIEGMEVSIDVSTCDADAGHRYFGTVTEISELDTA